MLWFRRELALAVVCTGLVACNLDNHHPDSGPGHSVVISAFDPNWKIRAIKTIRAETGLGLADAKRLIEETPSVVKEGLTQSHADALAARLRAQGMVVEIQSE